jgi:hypothetical protein
MTVNSRQKTGKSVTDKCGKERSEDIKNDNSRKEGKKGRKNTENMKKEKTEAKSSIMIFTMR